MPQCVLSHVLLTGYHFLMHVCIFYLCISQVRLLSGVLAETAVAAPAAKKLYFFQAVCVFDHFFQKIK